MTRADIVILEHLDDINAISMPKLIAYEIEYSRSWVSQRLAVLLDRGLVEQPDRSEIPEDDSIEGLYRISDLGRDFLSGDRPPGDFE